MRLADAIQANRVAVDRATKPDLRRLIPALKRAERDLANELGKWLHKQSPTDRYNRHRHRALIAQLHDTIKRAERKLGPALRDDVVSQGPAITDTAAKRLRAMVNASSHEYEGAIMPLRVDVASITANEQRSLLSKMNRHGAAYSKAVTEDVHARLSLGVLRGETIDQLTSRLLASSHLIRAFKKAGPDAVAGGISSIAARKYRGWAESIARTELVNAYASVQAAELKAADAEDPGWLMKWDAANDARVCPLCHSLDNKAIAPDGLFPQVGKLGARPHPPLHRCCRCALVPWRAEWAHKRGRSS